MGQTNLTVHALSRGGSSFLGPEDCWIIPFHRRSWKSVFILKISPLNVVYFKLFTILGASNKTYLQAGNGQGIWGQVVFPLPTQPLHYQWGKRKRKRLDRFQRHSHTGTQDFSTTLGSPNCPAICPCVSFQIREHSMHFPFSPVIFTSSDFIIIVVVLHFWLLLMLPLLWISCYWHANLYSIWYSHFCPILKLLRFVFKV